MLTTLDESYDNNHRYLIFGAAFHPSHKHIHREFLDKKRKAGYVDVKTGKAREIKYTLCKTKDQYQIAKMAVDCFIHSPSFFRAIVIDRDPTSGYNLKHFGKPSESIAIKEARAYKKYCELLLKSNLSEIEPNGLLYTDALTHCKGDNFRGLLNDLFATSREGYSKDSDKPIFKIIKEVDTSAEEYHLGQIGDLLQGVILNELIPGSNRWKKQIRNYVKSKLGIPSLAPDYWQTLPRYYKNQKHHKYQIWYWSPEKQ